MVFVLLACYIARMSRIRIRPYAAKIFAVAAAFTGTTILAAADPTTVRIGVILPLTGEATYWGSNARNGALLAIEDLNRDGKRFELVFEDSQCDPKIAVSAYHRLTSLHKVNYIVGDICSSGTLAVAALSDKARKILITPCSASPTISTAGEYVFRTWSPTTVETIATAEYVFNVSKIRKMAILYIENDFGGAIEKDFRTRFEALGGDVVYRESHPPAEIDLRTQLLKVKSSGAEGLFIVSHIADGLVAVKQAKELGVSVPIFGTTGINSQSDFVKPLGDLAEGIVLGDQKDLVDPGFKIRYSKTYAVPWPGVSSCAAATYDCVSLIAKGVNLYGDDTQSIQKWLASLKDFPGMSGTIEFDQNGDIVRPSQMYQILKGLIEPVSF